MKIRYRVVIAIFITIWAIMVVRLYHIVINQTSIMKNWQKRILSEKYILNLYEVRY